MLKKISIAAVALALSASAALASGYSSGNVNLAPDDFITKTFNLAAGSYSEAFSWGGLSLTSATNAPQSLGWALYNSNFDIVDSGSVAYNAGTKLGGSNSYGSLTLASGSYTVAFGTDNRLSASNAKYTLTAAVPGPISGAGLPALALAAGLMLLWRRKAESEG